MGKATIAGGGEEGSYQITIDYGKAARDARTAALTNRIAELSTKISEAQGEYDTAKIEVDAATVLASEAIEAYVLATKASDNPEDWTDELAVYKTRQTALLEAQAKAEPLRIKLAELKVQKAQAVKDKGYWEGIEIEETRQAWCVDLTEDATGEVGTVDVPGESTQILIAPGGRAHQQSDGALAAREVQSPEQVFFNAAILPGWQKFKPTYRIGIINALNKDADTADVSLVAATSSAQGLNVNRYTDLPGIPITYMTCNAGAFEEGDRVVVQFDNGEWNTARVIGFESNPKSCHPEFVYLPIGGATRDIEITGAPYEYHTGLVRVYPEDGVTWYLVPFVGWFTSGIPSTTAQPMSATATIEFTGAYFFDEGEEGIGAVVNFDGLRIFEQIYGTDPEATFPEYKWFSLADPTQVIIKVNQPEFSVVTRTWQKNDSFTGYDFVVLSESIEPRTQPVLGLLTNFNDGQQGIVSAEVGLTEPYYDDSEQIESTDSAEVSAWLQSNATFPPVEVEVSGKGLLYEYESCEWDAERNQWVLQFKKPPPP